MSLLPNIKELNRSLRLILLMGCYRSLLRLFQAPFPSESLSGDCLTHQVFARCLADVAAGCA